MKGEKCAPHQLEAEAPLLILVSDLCKFLPSYILPADAGPECPGFDFASGSNSIQ